MKLSHEREVCILSDKYRSHFLPLSRRVCERSADLAEITKQRVGGNRLQLDEKMTPYLHTGLLHFCDAVYPSYREISLKYHLFLYINYQFLCTDYYLFIKY